MYLVYVPLSLLFLLPYILQAIIHRRYLQFITTFKSLRLQPLVVPYRRRRLASNFRATSAACKGCKGLQGAAKRLANQGGGLQ